MSWNRPSGRAVSTKPPLRRGHRPRPVVAALAGAIVVLGAGIAAWLLWPDGEGAGETPPPRKEGLIREVTPAKVRERTVSTNKVVRPPLPQRVGEIRDGYMLLPNGKMHKVDRVMTNESARITLADRIFETWSDRTIGNVLTIEPGTSLLGDSKDYFKGFDKTFTASLKTPIEILPEDDQETRDLKQAVIEARTELKVMMDRGEDIVQVMRDTREQMRELGLYREELEREVMTIMRDKGGDFAEKDVKDLVDAANKMLEERGSVPMYLTSGMLYRLQRAKHLKSAKKGNAK